MIPDTLPNILRKHMDEVGILLRQRSRLLELGSAVLSDLDRVDDRISAHFDGLRHAGRAALDPLKEALEVSMDAGTLMPLAYMSSVVETSGFSERAVTQVAHARAMALGLCWHGPDTAREAAQALLRAGRPEQQMIGLHLCDLVAFYPEDALRSLASKPSPCQAFAIWLAAYAGLRDIFDDVDGHHRQDDPETEIARHCAILLMEPTRGPSDFLISVARDDLHSPNWLPLLPLVAMTCSAAQWTAFVAPETGATDVTAIKAIGFRGATDHLPLLFECLEGTACQTSAEASIRLITGVDLTDVPRSGVQTKVIANPFDPERPVQLESEADAGFEVWCDRWRRWSHEHPGEDLIYGAPPTVAHLEQLWTKAALPDRSLAALRARLLHGRLPPAAADSPGSAWRY